MPKNNLLGGELRKMGYERLGLACTALSMVTTAAQTIWQKMSMKQAGRKRKKKYGIY
ncbi:MAG: hypothetical protein L6Q53_07190 [Candidatus Brocadia sinica]|uniref:Uncharacterized protein n=1 Tax=Candidatus Brocadia sinica JPN1 TaxID=1197129 RepID=A0ABQ0JT66_9BACT|nr:MULTISPECIES: hypothetical protein [Brocadia]MCK6467965.1 hypothetical protein [Candidatus Brocadia sinica]NOG43483.1 hypothetical protein [Planctomycetota bacterium]NUO04230.1 hypothetical protein [Candidatus Brocadia sinica]GAN31908.1 hypothetical protein BROSI_A0412 [Candidatus Brocadia sinica JPN1]